MRALLAALLAIPLVACVRTYRPDYHPETSFSYVQNVTYAQNAWIAPQAPAPPVVDTDPCATGDVESCRSACFDDASARACLLLGRMTGARAGPAGQVSSPGSVIVYGDFNGTVSVGR